MELFLNSLGKGTYSAVFRYKYKNSYTSTLNVEESKIIYDKLQRR